MFGYRINRATYWVICAIVIAIVTAIAFSRHRSSGLEVMIVLIASPRLHDIGRSGWWAVGVCGTEFFTIVGATLAGADSGTVLILAGAVLLVICALGIWLGSIPGEPHANRWGEPPAPGIQFSRNPRSS